jgi:DNA-binding LacI/PurR family transcriptional regulator
MKRKPNIATVAERAGVAVSTVSRYLNDRYVSQKARARIARVIELLDYTRSSTARNLSLGRHGCIGVVVDSSQDPWFTRLLAGIETELSTRDSSLMLASTELTGEYDPGIVFEWIRERRVDGLIIAKSQRRDRVLIRRAVDAQLPTVLVAPDEAFHQVQLVRCDNRGAGVVVARSIDSRACAKGCRSIALRSIRGRFSRAAATKRPPAPRSRESFSRRRPT